VKRRGREGGRKRDEAIKKAKTKFAGFSKSGRK
jgi:hypothetical protein